MSLLPDEEKRRYLIAQIEKTAEEIRRGQGHVVGIDKDYSHLFLLGPRNPAYSKLPGRDTKVRLVFIWFLVAMFLMSSTALLVVMRSLGVV